MFIFISVRYSSSRTFRYAATAGRQADPLSCFRRYSMATTRICRRENGHPRPSDPPSARQRLPTPEVALPSPSTTARARALSEHAHHSPPLYFQAICLNPLHPAPRPTRPRRGERGPARRETVGFALCAPQPPYPQRNPGAKRSRVAVQRGHTNQSHTTCIGLRRTRYSLPTAYLPMTYFNSLRPIIRPTFGIIYR